MSGWGDHTPANYIRLIHRVQDHIEDCVRSYMNKSECKLYIQLHYNISPDLTEIVWNQIKRENEDFFRDYYVRLAVIRHINTFNMLLEEHARRTRDYLMLAAGRQIRTFRMLVEEYERRIRLNR